MTDDQPGDLITLDEMISRAELEPTLHDFYVEGRTDVAVYEAFFEHEQIAVSVFAISDRIILDREVVEKYDVDYGERSKLIAAASETSRLSPVAASRLTFVIDADWAEVTGPIPIARECLVMTDLPSLEHYFLESDGFAYALRTGLGSGSLDASTVRDDLKTALRDLAAARLTLKALNVESVAKLSNVFRYTAGKPRADFKELVKRSLHSAGGYNASAVCTQLKCAEQYREMLDEAHHPGRGHDIALVLIFYLKLAGHFSDPDVVETIMRISTPVSGFHRIPFFDRLKRRVANDPDI